MEMLDVDNLFVLNKKEFDHILNFLHYLCLNCVHYIHLHSSHYLYDRWDVYFISLGFYIKLFPGVLVNCVKPFILYLDHLTTLGYQTGYFYLAKDFLRVFFSSCFFLGTFSAKIKKIHKKQKCWYIYATVIAHLIKMFFFGQLCSYINLIDDLFFFLSCRYTNLKMQITWIFHSSGYNKS